MNTPGQNEAAIFNSARRIDAPDVRGDYLDRACGDDRALRHRIEALLRIHDEDPGFLRDPADEYEVQPGEGPGTVLGPYQLLEQIGEGGFGVVFRAEQQHPVRRQVALKVVKPGMDTKQVVARFEAERQALALMDHPNIARVLDGGEAPTGRPYFVMELVRGVSITDYCDLSHLTVRQRLELFVPVCQAVQHAHQKGVIHRDLKPSNILVAVSDGEPVAKVIDFGVAKAVGQKLTDNAVVTGAAQMIGTPTYMSPEQAEMGGTDVDTRADIYALGVVLYELLTGTTPFDQDRLRAAAFDEVRRIIRQEEPARPSARVSTLGAAAGTVTVNRQSDSKRLIRLVRGELDWIVMKCLEKDRARRYESAAALARDVRRYLDGHAVEASPPYAGYRLRKFLGRNKGPVLAASLVLLALVGGTGGTTVGMVEARHQAGLAWAAQANESEARARETQRAEAEGKERLRASAAEAAAKEQEREAKEQLALSSTVIDFLLDDLLGQAGSTAQADRRHVPDPNLTVRAALDRSAAAVGDKFRGRPKAEAVLRLTIGSAYRELGKYDKAIAQIRQAVDIRAGLEGSENPETLRARHELANAYRAAGHLDDAIRLYKEVHAAQAVNPGPEHPETLTTLNNLAAAYLDARMTAEAEALFKQVRDARLKLLGPEDPATLTTLHNLADVYRRTNRLGEAAKLYEDVRSAREKVLPPDHPQTLSTINNLAVTYWQMNWLDKSVPLFEQLVLSYRRTLGDRHPRTLRVQANLGVNYRDAGRLDKAIGLLEQVHRDGKEYPELHWVGRELFLAYARAGKSAEAHGLAKTVEGDARQNMPADSPRLAGELSLIGSAYLDLGEWTDAERLLRESLTIREKTEPDEWTTFNTRSRLGAALFGQGNYADAKPHLVDGFAGMKARRAQLREADRPYLVQAVERLVRLYEAWDNTTEADRWRHELKAAEAEHKK
jgi:serine/threonine protein kinase/tetratricopeptide (TPR) repeat protein